MAVITLEVDGRPLALPQGASLLEAIRAAGVALPVLLFSAYMRLTGARQGPKRCNCSRRLSGHERMEWRMT